MCAERGTTGPLSRRGWAEQDLKSSLKPSICSQLCGLLLIQSTKEHSGFLFVLFHNIESMYVLPMSTNDRFSFLLTFSLSSSALSVAPLPSLEWPLPSQSGQYELLIQQQPRSHHRAHYETEGSRGAVKTSNGGHPEVQVLSLFCAWRVGGVQRMESQQE